MVSLFSRAAVADAVVLPMPIVSEFGWVASDGLLANLVRAGPLANAAVRNICITTE